MVSHAERSSHQRYSAHRQAHDSTSMTMQGPARDPRRTVSTTGKSDILMRYGVPDFVASSLSQPRTPASRLALKRQI